MNNMAANPTVSGSDSIVSCSALHKTYEGLEVAVLNGIDLNVIAGEQVQISWPNLFVLDTSLSLPMGDIALAIGLKVSL